LRAAETTLKIVRDSESSLEELKPFLLKERGIRIDVFMKEVNDV